MLMVTTSVRMVDGVHGNTTSLWPNVTLDGVLSLSSGSLEERLVGTSTTGNDTNHTTGRGSEDLLSTGWELDTGLSLFRLMTDDCDVVTGGTSKSTSVSDLLFDVGHDSTFGHGSQWKDVTDGQRGLLSSVDELSSVHSLVGDESLMVDSELVGVTESNTGKWGTSSGVVDDVLDNTADVTVTLAVVEGSELGWVLSKTSVGSEDAASTLSLVADDSSHCV